MALWLHSDGNNDLLIPLAPSPEGIETNRIDCGEDLV
jgi:hypothetical protein